MCIAGLLDLQALHLFEVGGIHSKGPDDKVWKLWGIISPHTCHKVDSISLIKLVFGTVGCTIGKKNTFPFGGRRKRGLDRADSSIYRLLIIPYISNHLLNPMSPHLRSLWHPAFLAGFMFLWQCSSLWPFWNIEYRLYVLYFIIQEFFQNILFASVFPS